MKKIAVLYDVENLVGGYNLKYLSEISLKNICASVKTTEELIYFSKHAKTKELEC